MVLSLLGFDFFKTLGWLHMFPTVFSSHPTDPEDQLALLPLWACEAEGYRWPRCTSLHSIGKDWINRSHQSSTFKSVRNSIHVKSDQMISYFSSYFITWVGLAGVKRESLDTRFWDKREYSPSPSDVIMRTGLLFENAELVNTQHLFPVTCHRTKQWMSDDTWQPTIFLFLPASVAKRAQGDCPPGTGWKSFLFCTTSTQNPKPIYIYIYIYIHIASPNFEPTILNFQHLTAVFMEKPVNPQSDENKALRRYACHLDA